MEETKNLILAVVLSILVLLLWQIFYVNPMKEESAKTAEQAKIAKKVSPGEPGSLSADIDGGSKIKLSREEEIKRSFNQNERVEILTDVLDGSLSVRGARIDDLVLTEYRKSLELEEKEVLLSPKGSKNVYFAEFGWLSADKSLNIPNNKTLWQTNGKILTDKNPLVLTWNNKQGLTFTTTFTIDKNYMFKVVQTVENNAEKDITLYPYGLISRSREDELTIYISHEGPLGVFDEVLEEISYDDLKDDKNRKFKNTRGWLGIADKYWLTALIPPTNSSFDANFNYRFKHGTHRYQADSLGSFETISPGQKISVTQHFFAGAKKVGLLDEYTEDYSIPLFDRAVDFGWLYFITKPMFGALKFFNNALGNFGLGILALTVIIKLILFPLANKSYKSMAKMRKVMPELKDLREKHKDDRVKLNQEMMKLYKEKRINPMSGCLPILVQIPIFFALYKVLFITIEMRHAPFYGWIHDLSAPDPTNILNLFGLFSWTPPDFLPIIGIWPVLFCLTMLVQQKLNPPPTDPTQAMVMKLLPFLFLFIFAAFPAGLVIYWVWNNILSILQQWVITRKIEAED